MKKIYLIILMLTLVMAESLYCQISFIKRTIGVAGERVTGICSGDIDADGDMDIVVCNRLNNKIAYWRNDGGYPVKFTNIDIDPNFNTPMYNHVKDINNDGRLDVITSSASAGVLALWINKGGTPISWTKQVIDSSFPGAHAVYSGDIDNDGLIDIISSCGGDLNQVVWWKNGGGNPILWTKHIVAQNFHASQTITTADINGDNKLDIIAGSSGDNEISWWKNESTDTVKWTKHVISSTIGLPHWIFACDIDLDNDIDVLSVSYTGAEVAVWKNSGGDTIRWTKQALSSTFSTPLTVFAADFDNDNRLDVVATSFVGDKIGLWTNGGGNPISWTSSTIASGFNGPWPIYACDLDNDGDNDIISGADILGGSGVSASLTWWENKFILNDIKENEEIKLNYNLEQNYPNPFNPSTTISFNLKNAGFTNLTIYNMLGQIVKVLINEELYQGKHEVVFDASNSLSSSTYIYTLSCNGAQLSNKMMLIK